MMRFPEYKLAIEFDSKNASYQKALTDAYDVKVAPIVAKAVELHKAKIMPVRSTTISRLCRSSRTMLISGTT